MSQYNSPIHIDDEEESNLRQALSDSWEASNRMDHPAASASAAPSVVLIPMEDQPDESDDEQLEFVDIHSSHAAASSSAAPRIAELTTSQKIAEMTMQYTVGTIVHVPIEFDRVINQRKRINCCICLQISKQPDYFSVCGHFVCHIGCMTGLPYKPNNMKSCPMCRTDSLVPLVYNNPGLGTWQRDIFDVVIKCDNVGCHEEYEIGTRFCNEIKHKVTCEYRKEQCNQCHMDVLIKNKAVHDLSLCSQRAIECTKCGVKVPHVDMAIHSISSAIDSRLVCGGYQLCSNGCTDHDNDAFKLGKRSKEAMQNKTSVIRSEHMQAHIQNKCPRTLLTCEICGDKVTRLNMAHHDRIKAPNHILLAYRARAMVVPRSVTLDMNYRRMTSKLFRLRYNRRDEESGIEFTPLILTHDYMTIKITRIGTHLQLIRGACKLHMVVIMNSIRPTSNANYAVRVTLPARENPDDDRDDIVEGYNIQQLVSPQHRCEFTFTSNDTERSDRREFDIFTMAQVKSSLMQSLNNSVAGQSYGLYIDIYKQSS